jgi:hypothetical protein
LKITDALIKKKSRHYELLTVTDVRPELSQKTLQDLLLESDALASFLKFR